MSAVRNRVSLWPGWSRAAFLAVLFVLAAALFAQNNQDKEKGKENEHKNAPAKAQTVHGPQQQGHQEPSHPAAAGHPSNSPGNTAPGGGYHPGGSTGGQQNQANHPAAGSTPRTPNGSPGYRPASSSVHSPGSPGSPGKSFGTNRGPGGPMVVHRANTTVFRGPGGEQRIVHNLPGGGIAVANAQGHGYVQRSVTVRGAVFVQRTYYIGGRPQAMFYRPFLYRGIAFNVYAPMRFYTPRFYAWAYNPWAAPIYYNWGWGGNPWFGFYAGYFAPYPRYAAPNFWLTDYLLATSLQAAYQERMDAAAAASANGPPPPPPPGADAVAQGGQVTLTPEVKQAVADEVRQELEQERAESQAAQAAPPPPMQAQAPNPEPVASAPPVSNAPPPALSPNSQHVFIVSSVVVVSANGQQCAVTQGDILQLDPAPNYPDPSNARVLASKSADCETGKAVQVGLADLQEMQNHMREMLDQGLGEMQSRQGQGNLPVINASMRTQTPAPYAADLPAADPNVASELQQTAQASGPQAPKNAGPPPMQAPAPTPGAAPATIAIGQSINDVVAIMGQPTTKFENGQKTIYVYKSLKITFTAGKVSDVQ